MPLPPTLWTKSEEFLSRVAVEVVEGKCVCGNVYVMCLAENMFIGIGWSWLDSEMESLMQVWSCVRRRWISFALCFVNEGLQATVTFSRMLPTPVFLFHYNRNVIFTRNFTIPMIFHWVRYRGLHTEPRNCTTCPWIPPCRFDREPHNSVYFDFRGHRGLHTELINSKISVREFRYVDLTRKLTTPTLVPWTLRLPIAHST